MEAFHIEQPPQHQQSAPQTVCSTWPLSKWILIIGAGILITVGIFVITLVSIVETQLNSASSVHFNMEEIEADFTPATTLSLDYAINFTVLATKLSTGKFKFYETFSIFSIGNGTWEMKTALVQLPPMYMISTDNAHGEWRARSTGHLVTDITFSELDRLSQLIYNDEAVPMTLVITGKNSDHDPFSATCPIEVHLKNNSHQPPKFYACKFEFTSII